MELKTAAVFCVFLVDLCHGTKGHLRAPKKPIKTHRSLEVLDICPCGDLEYEYAVGTIGYDNSPERKTTPMERVMRSIRQKELVDFRLEENHKYRRFLENADMEVYAESCSCPLYAISGMRKEKQVHVKYYFKCCENDSYCSVHTSPPLCVVRDPPPPTTTTTTTTTMLPGKTTTNEPLTTTQPATTTLVSTIPSTQRTTTTQPTTSTVHSSTTTVGNFMPPQFSGICSDGSVGGQPTVNDCYYNNPCDSPLIDGNIVKECPDGQKCFPYGTCMAPIPTHFCGTLDANGKVESCGTKDCSSNPNDPTVCDAGMECLRECGVYA